MALTLRKKGLSPTFVQGWRLELLLTCSKILFQELRAHLTHRDEASFEVCEVIFHLVANLEVKEGQTQFCVTFHEAASGCEGISH
jgi:hypothetical protein